jgi:hypothetical protein
MAKDPTRNIERYKVSGSHLNEFEFHKNQASMAEQFEPIPNVSEGRPLTVAEQVALVTAEAHRKAEKRRKKLSKELQSRKASASSGAASLGRSREAEDGCKTKRQKGFSHENSGKGCIVENGCA